MSGNSAVIPITNRKSGGMFPKASLWAVASGKGGVGKSFLASSLAIILTKMGLRVTLIDLDTKGGNVHSFFGGATGPSSVVDFFENKTQDLQSLCLPTSVLNLKIINGFINRWTSFEVNQEDAKRVVQSAKRLKTDIVIFDLSAGPSVINNEVLKASDERLLVTTPDPICIESNYRFLESYILSELQLELPPDVYQQLVYSLRNFRRSADEPLFSLRNFLLSKDIDFNFFEKITKSPLRLITNQCRNINDQELGYSIKSVCSKYYDLNVDYAGSLDFDNAAWQCARTKSHLLLEQPFSPLVGQFQSLAKHLVDPTELKAVV